jgi:hypothetical protein
MLAKRLARRGVSLSGGTLAVVLAEKVACAGVPISVVSSTIKAANLFAAGQTAGVVTAKVAALTEGVVKAMFLTRIKNVLTVVLVLVALAGGAGLLYQTRAADPPQDSNKAAQAPKPADKEAQAPATPAEKTSPKNAGTKQKVLTTEEAIKQRQATEQAIKQSQEKVTVKFKVTVAQTMRVSKSNVIFEDVGFNEVLLLKDGDTFCVQLLPPTMDTIRRLGIEPETHFKGKVVQVTGLLQPGQPAFGTGQFQIAVTDLTQFAVVGK